MPGGTPSPSPESAPWKTTVVAPALTPACLSNTSKGSPDQTAVLTPAPPERFPAHSKVSGRRTDDVSKRSEYESLRGLATMPLISRFHFSSLINGVLKWLRIKKSTFGVTTPFTVSFELAASKPGLSAVQARRELSWPLKYLEAKPLVATAASMNSRR